MRTEHDFLGEMPIPENALYGIHSARAVQNFPVSEPFNLQWYKAMALVKLACYNTVEQFEKAASEKFPEKTALLNLPQAEVLKALQASAQKAAEGRFFDQIIVPALQGGAGTSINLNVNEILANAALLELNHKPGQYHIIDPIEQANIFQSTNDVVPTALKVAAMKLLNELEESINLTRKHLEAIEQQHRNTLRIAYTQMQQAVPGSYGHLFGGYNEALSRDWWRVSKCFERIKTVNLGGGATGTGAAIPRFFIMEVVTELKKLTGLPVTQSENLMDNTANLDSLVEVHAVLKSHAVNLEKMVSDIRLLASDIVAQRELSIPARQTGSSIMPGKVNPVIVEFVVSTVHKIYANDQIITHLSAMGTLDLNAYLPSIGQALLQSLEWLVAANKTVSQNLLSGLHIQPETSAANLYQSPAVCTVLSPVIGYNKAAQLAKYMRDHQCTVFDANTILTLIDDQTLEKLMQPGNLLQKGFSVNDL